MSSDITPSKGFVSNSAFIVRNGSYLRLLKHCVHMTTFSCSSRFFFNLVSETIYRKTSRKLTVDSLYTKIGFILTFCSVDRVRIFRIYLFTSCWSDRLNVTFSYFLLVHSSLIREHISLYYKMHWYRLKNETNL